MSESITKSSPATPSMHDEVDLRQLEAHASNIARLRKAAENVSDARAAAAHADRMRQQLERRVLKLEAVNARLRAILTAAGLDADAHADEAPQAMAGSS